jgi:flagellar basal-body rod modification protein FlgD
MTTSTVNSSASQSIINSLNASSSIASSSTSSSSSSGATAASMQSQFLKLLTTQLQNQDPTSPLDSAQMTSQLAQISTVEGISQLNTTLTTLLNNLSASQSAAATSLVGQGVMVPASNLTLTSSGALGGIDLANNADKVVVTVKNSAGTTVKTLDLGSLKAGISQFTWDGTTDSGGTAATGNYTISIAATQGSNNVTATPLSLGTVSSITNDNGASYVNVSGLGSFALSSVAQIF